MLYLSLAKPSGRDKRLTMLTNSEVIISYAAGTHTDNTGHNIEPLTNLVFVHKLGACDHERVQKLSVGSVIVGRMFHLGAVVVARIFALAL